MTFDGKAFGAEVVAVVKDYLAKETKPLIERISALEKQVREFPAQVDYSPQFEELWGNLNALKRLELPSVPKSDDIEQVIKDCIARSIQSLDLEQLIAGKVSEAVGDIPKPMDGKSVTVDDVRPLIVDEVARRVADLPVAKNGDPGRDGVGLAGALIDRDGQLVVTMSNGETKNLGPVVGKDGAPGNDGFSLEHFDAALQDDGRTILLSFSGVSHDYAVELAIPAMIYRGVWREQAYAKGDTVTWGGSLWHCDVDDNSEKPGDGSKSWTLAAKRGRDGKDAVSDSKRALTSIRVGVPSKEAK